VQIDEAEEVIGIFDAVLQRYPNQSRTHLSKASALKSIGRQTDAVAACFIVEQNAAVFAAQGCDDWHKSAARIQGCVYCSEM
jgi:hypothetical protein